MTIWEILAALIWTIYLRKVSVSNLAFIAFISSEGVVTDAAACVYVALLGHWTDHIAATLLHINTQKTQILFRHENIKEKLCMCITQTCILVQRFSHGFVSTKWAWQLYMYAWVERRTSTCYSGHHCIHVPLIDVAIKDENTTKSRYLFCMLRSKDCRWTNIIK